MLRAVTCIDLTTLAGDDTESNVKRLCFKAKVGAWLLSSAHNVPELLGSLCFSRTVSGCYSLKCNVRWWIIVNGRAGNAPRSICSAPASSLASSSLFFLVFG